MVNIFWFRRDLRLEDNAGLYHALKSSNAVLPIFIFDTNILNKLPNKSDARVNFIFESVKEIKAELQKNGQDLLVFYGDPFVVWQSLLKTYIIGSVFLNHDYESYSILRDTKIAQLLETQNIPVHSYKDHVIFEKNEITKDDGNPYTVFTPYKKKWLSKLDQGQGLGKSFFLKSYPSAQNTHKIYKPKQLQKLISLEEMGFFPSDLEIPPKIVKQSNIIHYDTIRDFPAMDATSKLGIHFRFGTVSVRKKAAKASILNQTYLNELIWRDFYAMILYHYPHVEKYAFRSEYERIEWRNNEEEFQRWCDGNTGYPIVDAGMRQLKSTGYMHNRVRMITASFLTKHLLIDWRWGEAWFAEHLLDFDLASNNGGWQWAAGCGTDAAPYFRIFSPDAQTKKFDKNQHYIRKWVPEFDTHQYLLPIVDHNEARIRCLTAYKSALSRTL